jgi:hypothetical protein
MEFIVNETHPTVLQTMRAFVDRPDLSVTDFDTTYYAPIIKNRWSAPTSSRNTGIQVQNVSGGPVDVDITYVGNPLAAACAGQTYTSGVNGLPDGESATFLSRDDIPDFPCLAAATIVATGNILAIVNESYSPIPAGTFQEATSYNAFPDNQKTNIVSIPLFKENSFGKKTGISVMNVGAADATNVVAKFIGPAGTFTTDPLSIDQGGSLILLDVRNQTFWDGTAMTPAALGCHVPDDTTGCGANGVMGVIITSDQPIVAIANETAVARFFLQDKNNYEGFNLTFDPTVP